jgi:hypothetical protein
MSHTRRLAAIVAADVTGYSRLIEADEGGTLRGLKEIKTELLDPVTAEHNGQLIKDDWRRLSCRVQQCWSMRSTVSPKYRREASRRNAQGQEGRSMALLFNVMLAVALLWCGWKIPAARAQIHTQSFELVEATIPQLQSALSTGIVTSHELVAQYLARIEAYDQHGPALNAISVTNGNALAEADARDAEHRAGVRPGC